MRRRILVSGLCALLVLSLFGANVALASDRGPFDPDHVTDSAAEAGLYEAMSEQLRADLAEQRERDAEFDHLVDAVIEAVVSEEWVQRETERNVETFFAHLEDDHQLDLYVEVRRDRVADAIERELSIAEFGNESLSRLLESESAYEKERIRLRERFLAEIGFEPDRGFGVERLEGLIASEKSYEETREAIREDIVDAALDRAGAHEGFGNDRLGAMYNDSVRYEEEQEAFREEQKERIQNETARELSDEELAEVYHEERDDIIEHATEAAIDRIEIDDGPDGIEAHAADLAALKVEALATDLTHEEFVERYDEIVTAASADFMADFEENPAAYEDEIHDHVEATLADADIPEEVRGEADGIVDATIEAVTTEMSHEEHVEAYDDAVLDLEKAIVTYAWEHREKYAEEIQSAELADAELEAIPVSVEPELEAIVALVLEATLTDMSYETFTAEFDDREAALADGVAEALFEEERVPSRVEIADDSVTEDRSELAVLGWLVGGALPLAVVLSLLSVVATGAIHHVVRDPAITAIVAGSGAVIGALPAIGAGWFLVWGIRDTLEGSDLAPELTEAIAETVALVFFAPLVGQSMVLVSIGALVAGGGIAAHFGLVDAVRERVRPD